jgi:hypothetical protein
VALIGEVGHIMCLFSLPLFLMFYFLLVTQTSQFTSREISVCSDQQDFPLMMLLPLSIL